MNKLCVTFANNNQINFFVQINIVFELYAIEKSSDKPYFYIHQVLFTKNRKKFPLQRKFTFGTILLNIHFNTWKSAFTLFPLFCFASWGISFPVKGSKSITLWLFIRNWAFVRNGVFFLEIFFLMDSEW